MKRTFALVCGLVLAACGPEALPPPPPPPPPPKPDREVATANAGDPLGPRPPVPPPAAFVPPEPKTYVLPNGIHVWLLERHSLPIVSVDFVMPLAGSAADPDGKGGLAHATATMLDEGAGTRDALAIARDIDKLGATLHTGAYADYAFVQLTSLKKNLPSAAAIMTDVITKPTFAPVEWKRVSDLWKNDLAQRQSDPSAVANVVTSSVVFGPGSLYAHPTDGTTKSAARVSLDDVKKFYDGEWHPARATCVVVGDITKDELDKVFDAALAKWVRPKIATKPVPEPIAKAGRRVFIVDRPDAPQSVVAVARRGVAASDPDAPPLVRVNAAIGGSFTSRLNQDLREEHGWSYGARSRFSFTKLPGIFVASAAVHTEHTGEALQAMLKDIESVAKEGLTDEEVQKTRLLARAELVEAYESVEGAARRLARNAAIGLPPDHEAKASRALDGASKDELAKLAKKYVDIADAAIIIVGPRAKLDPQLQKIGITGAKPIGPEGE